MFYILAVSFLVREDAFPVLVFGCEPCIEQWNGGGTVQSQF